MLSPIAYLSHMTTVLGDIAAKSFLAEVSTASLFYFFYLLNLCLAIILLKNNSFVVFTKQATAIIGVAEFNPKR